MAAARFGSWPESPGSFAERTTCGRPRGDVVAIHRGKVREQALELAGRFAAGCDVAGVVER